MDQLSTIWSKINTNTLTTTFATEGLLIEA